MVPQAPGCVATPVRPCLALAWCQHTGAFNTVGQMQKGQSVRAVPQLARLLGSQVTPAQFCPSNLSSACGQSRAGLRVEEGTVREGPQTPRVSGSALTTRTGEARAPGQPWNRKEKLCLRSFLPWDPQAVPSPLVLSAPIGVRGPGTTRRRPWALTLNLLNQE